MNTYLITGGAGFIGSHLAERLLEAGERVTALDDLSTGSWQNIAHLERDQNFRAIIASADDSRLIADEMPRHSHVFHLASAVGVRLVVDRPVETVQRIVRTTDVIVDAAARYRRPVLLTSTSEVYGKLNDVPFREDSDTIMGATSKRRWAYACAKALDEFLLLAHHAQTSLPVFIVRLFNTVGVRQSGQYGMVLPSFIEAAKRGEPLQVFGSGEQTRCFCSVHDVVSGLIKIMDCPNAAGKVVNLGSQEEISIKSLAELVIKVTNSKSKIIYKTYQDAYGNGFDDMLRRVPDLQRVSELINWKPTKRLEEIIREIYENNSTPSLETDRVRT